MKILFILPEIDGGGIATYYQEQFACLLAEGHEISVCVSSEKQSSTSRDIPYGINFIPVDFSGKQRWVEKFEHLKIFDDLTEKLAVAWLLYEQVSASIDADIIETTDYNLLFVPWIVNKVSIPVVVSLHGSCGQMEYWENKINGVVSGWIIQSIETELLRRADGLYAYSPLNQKFWQEQLGVEVKYFPPALKLPEQMVGNTIKPNAVVVGRVQLWKGAELLYRTMSQTPDISVQVYWIGGDNYYREYNQSMTEYLKNKWPEISGKKIIHTGYMTYGECQKMIGASNFLLVPSLWDTFNFTAAEAMGAGKVVLVSDCAGVESLIEDGVNGFTFHSGNTDDLARKIKHIVSLTQREREAIGEKARGTISNRLNDFTVIPPRIDWYAGIKKKNKHESDWIDRFLNPFDFNSPDEVVLKQIPARKILVELKSRIKSKIKFH